MTSFFEFPISVKNTLPLIVLKASVIGFTYTLEFRLYNCTLVACLKLILIKSVKLHGSIE